jgi:hypothetical protein
MTAVGRVKRGPLIKLREGSIVPESIRTALVALRPGEAPQPAPATAVPVQGSVPAESGDADLATECRYAVAIAAKTLGADPATRNLLDADRINDLWKMLDKNLGALSGAVASLGAVRLQDLYADLERLEPERSVRAREERRRIIALFDSFADAERTVARMQQQIVSACRALETITPGNAVEQLHAVESMLDIPARERSETP